MTICVGNVDARFPRCATGAIDRLTVRSAPALTAAAERLAIAPPFTGLEQGRCGPAAPVIVLPRRGGRVRQAKLVVRIEGRTTDGRRDADRLVLRRRPR